MCDRVKVISFRFIRVEPQGASKHEDTPDTAVVAFGHDVDGATGDFGPPLNYLGVGSTNLGFSDTVEGLAKIAALTEHSHHDSLP